MKIDGSINNKQIASGVTRMGIAAKKNYLWAAVDRGRHSFIRWARRRASFITYVHFRVAGLLDVHRYRLFIVFGMPVNKKFEQMYPFLGCGVYSFKKNFSLLFWSGFEVPIASVNSKIYTYI